MVGMETTFIYALIDPDTEEIRYIGKADNPKERFRKHLYDKHKCYRTSWIKSLLTEGKKPKLKILQQVPQDTWEFWERAWIASAQDFPLVNQTSGGEGCKDFNDDALGKMRSSHLGHKASEETKRKMSEALMGHPVSTETRFKIAEANRNSSEETRRKRSVSMTGRKFSVETRIRLSEAHKGIKPSKEAIRKRVEKITGRVGWAKGKPWTAARRAAYLKGK